MISQVVPIIRCFDLTPVWSSPLSFWNVYHSVAIFALSTYLRSFYCCPSPLHLFLITPHYLFIFLCSVGVRDHSQKHAQTEEQSIIWGPYNWNGQDRWTSGVQKDWPLCLDHTRFFLGPSWGFSSVWHEQHLLLLVRSSIRFFWLGAPSQNECGATSLPFKNYLQGTVFTVWPRVTQPCAHILFFCQENGNFSSPKG